MSALDLGLGLSLGGRRVGDAGNMPATFTIAAGSVDDGIKRINFSEPVTVTITGGVTLHIGSTQYQSGDTIPVATGEYHTLTINNPGADGTITFGKRKQITYLYLAYLNSLVVKGDITGMKLTSLLLYSLGLSTITGDISGMELTYLQGERDPGELPATFTVTAGDGTKYVRVQVSETTTVIPAGGTSIRIGSSGDFVTTPLTLAANTNQDIYFKDAGSFSIPKRKLVTYLYLFNIGSSAITGDITGMKLTTLYLFNIGSSAITGDITGMKLTSLTLVGLSSSSVITGDITGMELTRLQLQNIGSSLTYGTNLLNITSPFGIQLLGDTVFATAAEYEQLIQDAASGTWGGKHPFVITAGTTNTDPGWENVKAYVAILLTKAAWTIIPSAWLSANGGSWPADWNEYTGE